MHKASFIFHMQEEGPKENLIARINILADWLEENGWRETEEFRRVAKMFQKYPDKICSDSGWGRGIYKKHYFFEGYDYSACVRIKGYKYGYYGGTPNTNYQCFRCVKNVAKRVVDGELTLDQFNEITGRKCTTIDGMKRIAKLKS